MGIKDIGIGIKRAIIGGSERIENRATARLMVCEQCDKKKGRICGQCGCVLAWKSRSEGNCPLNKWENVDYPYINKGMVTANTKLPQFKLNTQFVLKHGKIEKGISNHRNWEDAKKLETWITEIVKELNNKMVYTLLVTGIVKGKVVNRIIQNNDEMLDLKKDIIKWMV